MAAFPIGGIESDRVGGVRLALGDNSGSILSIIGVYLSCMDQGMEVYSEHLAVLERAITESQSLGKVVIVGDFNAHLGKLVWVMQIPRVFCCMI